jgi:O-antigen/teichoic acid export membrane protein
MFEQLKRLAKHSAIYGLGGVLSRIIAVLLLPLYTRYLSPRDYGAIETLVALVVVLMSVLRAGIASAFFRFYFDSEDEAYRVRVVRTSFWFTMATATTALVVGLVLAAPIGHALFGHHGHVNLVRAAFVGLWAQINYDQLTSLFRVEERSVSYAIASLVNIALTIGLTILLVVVLHKGPIGVLVGNFSGTLAVYVVLLYYRRFQLGLEFDRRLFRAMNHFGMPFVPSVIALSAIDFSDRFFLVKLAGQREVGLYSIGVRLSSAIIFLLTAFRTAWPAFAYSIEDDEEARRTYSFVLTYLLYAVSWLALGLGLLAPWLVHLLTTPHFYSAQRVVGLLAFSAVAYSGYVVVLIGIGRARRTQSNWVITGAAALLNLGLNVILIPPYGMIGAAISTIAAYVAMFLAMAWRAQHVFPVPYQWRRIVTLCGAAVGLFALGKAVNAPLPVAAALTACYPLLLFLLGFYLPEERARMTRVLQLSSR